MNTNPFGLKDNTTYSVKNDVVTEYVKPERSKQQEKVALQRVGSRTTVADWKKVAQMLADALDKQCPVTNEHLAMKDKALKAYYELSSATNGGERRDD